MNGAHHVFDLPGGHRPHPTLFPEKVGDVRGELTTGLVLLCCLPLLLLVLASLAWTHPQPAACYPTSAAGHREGPLPASGRSRLEGTEADQDVLSAEKSGQDQVALHHGWASLKNIMHTCV